MTTREELIELADHVRSLPDRDYSRVRSARQPVRWDYLQVVRDLLKPSSEVLDVGTGRGEKLLELAPQFADGTGIDIDPIAIASAISATPRSLAHRVRFQVMPGEMLDFDDGSFDAVLNRHAPVDVDEVVRVLKPGGLFISQQVGERNLQNICEAFECTAGGAYESDPEQLVPRLAERFVRRKCFVLVEEQYDVEFRFLDVESLVYLLNAVPIPEDFDMSRHWPTVASLVDRWSTPTGIVSNEHRRILVAKK